MKNIILLFTTLFLTSGARADLPAKYIAVANRAASTISIIDTATLKQTFKIGPDQVKAQFEPMYVSPLKALGAFAVGDRKGSRVLIFDDVTGSLLRSIPTSQGVFHQWSDPSGKALFVVGDVDRAVDIIKLARHGAEIIFDKKVFQVPAKYATGVPHDVITDDHFFFLTIKGANINGQPGDYVLKIDIATQQITGELIFSNETHLGLPVRSPYLYVVEQAAGKLNIINRSSFKVLTTLGGIPNAHGIIWSETSPRLFVTNFLSAGAESVFDITFGRGGARIQSVQKSFAKMPHNLAWDEADGLLFATQSGAGNKGVSVYSTKNGLMPGQFIDTDENPFGLALIQPFRLARKP